MECPRCHDANADGARFCGECGASLTRDVTCAGCGQANPVGQKFCNGCGQRLGESAGAAERDPHAYTPKHLADKILASKSALEGERKQVTVLFADVKGSMELAEQVDPEVFHQIMERFAGLLAEGVHRFEGTVTQFTGDGVMALFGAPIAHEDHAQRACYAALHLGDALRRYATELRLQRGLNFAVRMGINSGEVVVGKIGDDLRMDYTAQGHVVGLAARMEQIAEPGTVYVSEHTARLVTGIFRLADLGPLTVKGVTERLRVCELEGVGTHRTPFDVSRARGFSRFVGRDAEIATLEAALARAAAGDGQVVGVVAEAGVGKSRLSDEFVQRCRARGIPVDEAHGAAHGKMVPYLLVLEFLRGYFGIGAQDTAQAMREKIAGKLLLLDPALADTLPLLLDFLGVPDPERPLPRLDPEVRQHRLFEAMKRLTHARSRHEPGVSLIEDLHW
ncbi:MAG TPA: adenylate/guanylate cyclase domain-containing protein, partial [Candidatus Binatia bacterium]|nr:adenylate/guanylate cyclase domain-containing protein [Candidatus Binatia bacterium]